jgi:hypothetical protein
VRNGGSTIAVGNMHDLFIGGLSAVIAPIDMETRRIEMGERGRQPQTPGRRGGNEAVEFGQPRLIQCSEGAPEGVIMEMPGLNAWGNEARERLIVGKKGHEGQLLVEKAQAVQDHSFDRMADGHNPHFRVLLRRVINDRRDAEFFKHPRD